MKNNKLLSLVLLFFAGLLSLGQLQRLQITETTALYLHDLFILQTLVIALVGSKSYRSAVKEFFLHRSLSEKVLAGVVAIGWIISMLFGHSLLTPLLYAGRLAVYFLFGHLLFFLVQKKVLRPLHVSFAFLLFGIFVAAYGLLQYIFLPDTRFLFFLGWDDHYYRVISTLLDPGFTGIVAVMSLWLLHSVAKQLQFKYVQVAQWFLTGVLILTLLLTYSRASYLAFGATVGLYILFQLYEKKIKMSLFWVGVALLFVAAIPFLPRPGGEGVKLERTVSTSARISATQQYLQNLHGYEWVIGQGVFVSDKQTVDPDGYGFPDHAQVADSWPIFILSGTGLIGLVLFVVILIKQLSVVFKANKEVFLILTAVLIHGLFNATLIYPFVVLFMAGSLAGGVTQKTSR